MGLEDKILKIEGIPHESIGRMVVVDRTEIEIPKCSIEELSKEEDYLRQNLTELYNSEEAKGIIGMAGVIGVGKTTMACHLQKWTQGLKYLERTNSPGLNCLYAKGGKQIFGFPYQFDVGSDREKIMQSVDGAGKSGIVDRTWQEDMLFAENFYKMGALTERQFNYVKKFIIDGVKRNKQPDVIISLQASDDTLNERVKERNRKIEMQGIKSLSEQERNEMILKKEEMLGYVKKFAPEELEDYRIRQAGFEIPKEILMEGAPPEYIIQLNGFYKTRLTTMLDQDFEYNGVLLKINVDSKDGIDARRDTYGQVPIMRALKEARILSLLRKGYSIVEKANREGLDITPPWKAKK